MSKCHLTTYHPIDLWHWGLVLMQSALRLRGPKRRQVQLRDGLLISILAFRGIRLRSITSLTLGGSMTRDPYSGAWRLDLQPEDVKNRKYISTQLAVVLAPWLDRYVEVERQELLNGARSDAFWINWGGEKLEEKGVDKRIRWLSAKRFGPGNAFGTHRFRHCIASTAPIILPEYPGLAATLLQISHGVLNEHYDRGSDVMALKALHKTIAADRKATEHLAREAFGPDKSALARIIHDTHDGWISSVSRSPDGCARAGWLSGAGAGSMVRIAGFEIAVEGLDRGDTAPWFK